MTSPDVAVSCARPAQLADYTPGSTFGPRELRDYEFVWLLRGSATWTVQKAHEAGAGEESTRHVLRPGSLALSRLGTVDSYQWDGRRRASHAYVHFAIDNADGLPDPDGWPLVRPLAEVPVLSGICSYLVDLGTLGPAVSLTRSDQLVALLLDLFVTGPSVIASQPLAEPVAAVVSRVAEIWEGDGLRPVSVAELTEATNLSAGHLFRVFRRHFGCGPVHALELVRLSRAASWLQRSNATLTEVAHRAGFANAYHFSRRFAAAYGSPPGAFRRLSAVDPLAPLRRAGLLPLAVALFRR